MSIHVVVNTRAARFRADARRIERLCRVCDGRACVYPTGSLHELETAAQAIASQSPSLVVLCGGDGTYMAGLTALARTCGEQSLPSLALGSGGGSSTVARNWGRVLREPADHVEALLRAWESGTAAVGVKPTLRVREAGGHERLGFIFGTGMVASFFQAFYERGGGGYAQAAPLIGRIFFGSLVGGSLASRVLSPMPCRLVLDGVPHPNEAFTLVAVSVVRDLGMRLRVTHRAAEDLGRPHLVAAALSVRDCGLQYHRVLRGLPLVGPRHVDGLFGNIEVRFAGDFGPYVLDGDLLEMASVTVRAGPVIRLVSLRKPLGERADRI